VWSNKLVITELSCEAGTFSFNKYAAESVKDAPKPSIDWYPSVSSTNTVGVVPLLPAEKEIEDCCFSSVLWLSVVIQILTFWARLRLGHAIARRRAGTAKTQILLLFNIDLSP
jgi:hypothetical protein